MKMKKTTKNHFRGKGLVNMKASARNSWGVIGLFAGTMLCAPLQVTGQAIRFDAATVSGLPARNIGSATMSGRIAAVDAVEEDGRITVFVGAASGGVWKSVNGGTTFKPVFDREDVQSIGAVAIDPTNSKIVWVGTGESWVRNSVSVGDGVYKSTDGGENWTNVGLKDSEHIAKILVIPRTVTLCMSAPPATCGMTTRSAVFTRPPTEARAGKKSLQGLTVLRVADSSR